MNNNNKDSVENVLRGYFPLNSFFIFIYYTAYVWVCGGIHVCMCIFLYVSICFFSIMINYLIISFQH